MGQLIDFHKKLFKKSLSIDILLSHMEWCNLFLFTHIYTESVEGIWLQGEAVSQAHSFRDAEPHPVIPANAKNSYQIFPKQLRPCNNTSLQPLTSVYLALNDNEVLLVTTESVYFDLNMRRNTSCYLYASAWLCGSASKCALKTWCLWGCFR